MINTITNFKKTKKYFYLLKYSLELLKNSDLKEKRALSFLFFTAKFMILTGHRYNFAECKECGPGTGRHSRFYFDPARGSIYCPLHAATQKYPLDKKTADILEIVFAQKYLELKNRNPVPQDFRMLPVFNIFKDLIVGTFKADETRFTDVARPCYRYPVSKGGAFPDSDERTIQCINDDTVLDVGFRFDDDCRYPSCRVGTICSDDDICAYEDIFSDLDVANYHSRRMNIGRIIYSRLVAVIISYDHFFPPCS